MKTGLAAADRRSGAVRNAGTTTPALLVRHVSHIAAQLRASAPSPGSFTGLMASYHMGWVDRAGRATQSQPGKFIRPALCLWANEACGGDASAALPVAVSLEWMHNFTLVHDDIQDGDRERRGRDTVWSVWGSEQGINAGDALQALAFRMLAGDGVHPERRLRAIRLIADAVLVVVEGQSLDLRLEGQPQTPLRTYLGMIRAKTGALIGASLEAGAVMAGAAPALQRGLQRAGVLLGAAFQIRDDWLGTWGDSVATGKSSSGDLGRCKLTYPVVAGYGRMHEEQRARMRALFSEGSGDAASLRELLEEAGGAELTSAAPQHFAEKAIAIIRTLDVPHHCIDEFSEVAHYVTNRSR